MAEPGGLRPGHYDTRKLRCRKTERLIAAGSLSSPAVYMAFPTDYAIMPVIGKGAFRDYARQRSSGLASRGGCDRQRPFGKQDRLHPAGHHHRRAADFARKRPAVVDASGLPFATQC